MAKKDILGADEVTENAVVSTELVVKDGEEYVLATYADGTIKYILI